MFDLDPTSKRTQLALRFFTYGVMTVATIVISTIMVFFALGYRLDKNFHFTQGGLVQFVSTPNNASIAVDGALQGIHTPDKLNLSAGQHTISMSLAGYQSWSKTVDLAAGQLLWLNYIRLIPTMVTTKSVRDFDSLSNAVPSPDQHWILLQPKNDSPNFTLVDISDETSPKFSELQIPDSVLTKQDGQYGTFSIVEWDLGSQYVLIKHQVGSTIEFIRIDRSNASNDVNITNMYGFSISEAHFSGGNPNTLYVNTDGVLRSLDIGSQSASGALVDNLKDFVVYGQNTIAFTAQQEQTTGDPSTMENTVGIWHDGKTTIVRSIKTGTDFLFAYSQYDNHEYLAYAMTDSSVITILRDPSDSSSKTQSAIFTTFGLDTVPQWLSFSENGRMVVAESGNHFASYDIEVAKSYQVALNVGAVVPNQLHWLDDFYLWTDAGGQLHIFEFDGTNVRSITSIQPGYDVTLSANGKRLFSIGKTTDKITLQSSILVTH